MPHYTRLRGRERVASGSASPGHVAGVRSECVARCQAWVSGVRACVVSGQVCGSQVVRWAVEVSGVR